MKFRIRRIDSRDYGNSALAALYEFIHVVEQEVIRKEFGFFGKPVPVWVRVASGISQQVAENELRKLLAGPRPHVDPVTIKEIEV